LGATNGRAIVLCIGRRLAVMDTAAPAAFMRIHLRCEQRGGYGPQEQDQQHEAGDATAHNSYRVPTVGKVTYRVSSVFADPETQGKLPLLAGDCSAKESGTPERVRAVLSRNSDYLYFTEQPYGREADTVIGLPAKPSVSAAST
jgi:hypothetical protein